MTIPQGPIDGSNVPARKIAASSPAMRSAVQALATANRSIEDQLDTLEREVATLRASWDGEAQASYDAAQRQWASNLGEMNAVLSRISSRIGAVDESYRAASRNIGRAN